MSKLVFNSFPRSANVYLGNASSYVFRGMYTTVHLPEIFIVKDLHFVTVFRKPEDALSSLVNKQLERRSGAGELDEKLIISIAEKEMPLYRKYLTEADSNSDHIYIAKFEDITKNTLNHFENISKRFNIDMIDDYERSFALMEPSGKIWSDQFDGHLPREKTETRILIETALSKSSSIQTLNSEYNSFIQKHVPIDDMV
jgi:hypothetical protein